jgi:hypothetical protein
MTKNSVSLMDVYNLVNDLRGEMNDKFEKYQTNFEAHCRQAQETIDKYAVVADDYKSFKAGLVARLSVITVIISSVIMFFAEEIKNFFLKRG